MCGPCMCACMHAAALPSAHNLCQQVCCSSWACAGLRCRNPTHLLAAPPPTKACSPSCRDRKAAQTATATSVRCTHPPEAALGWLGCCMGGQGGQGGQEQVSLGHRLPGSSRARSHSTPAIAHPGPQEAPILCVSSHTPTNTHTPAHRTEPCGVSPHIPGTDTTQGLNTVCRQHQKH